MLMRLLLERIFLIYCSARFIVKSDFDSGITSIQIPLGMN